METYTNIDGIECVYWIDEDGLQHSMLKSTWDELQAKQSEGGLN